jgi:pectate lyase
MAHAWVSSVCILAAVSLGCGYSVGDKPEGWASQSGGTTGGAGGTEVAVATMAQLQAEAKSAGKKIILLAKGTYSGRLDIASDKSLLGREPGVLIKGDIHIDKASNIILRNVAVQGVRCDSYDACHDGQDGIRITGSHHIWLDHLDVSDGQDGNCDITNGSDFVTVTWCKFWYSYAKEHRFSNLIAADDNLAIDKGKLNITYAYCWWADRVVERMPRGRAGKVHVVNNLYTSADANYACGPGVEIQMLIENNDFRNAGYAIKKFDGSPAPAWKSAGNIGSAKDIATGQGPVFTPPYALSLRLAASEVDAKVRPAAGNKLTLDAEPTALFPPESPPGRPSPERTPFGWRLRNPGLAPLGYRFYDARGRTQGPAGRLEAGRTLTLSRAGSAWILRMEQGEGN